MRDLSGNFVGEKSSEKETIVTLCQEFYRLGWMTGTEILTMSDKSKTIVWECTSQPTLWQYHNVCNAATRIKTLPF